MLQKGDMNSDMKAVFDPSLGKHGGTRYRDADGRFVPNPNREEPWYCQKSPTGAHYWVITTYQGRCKYCHAVQDLPEPMMSALQRRSQ